MVFHDVIHVVFHGVCFIGVSSEGMDWTDSSVQARPAQSIKQAQLSPLDPGHLVRSLCGLKTPYSQCMFIYDVHSKQSVVCLCACEEPFVPA